jgi:catecholate siderophore receptor
VDRQARFTTPNGFTAASLSVPTGTIFYDRVNDSVTNLTNLSARFATGGVSHTLAAGVELTWEESRANRMGAAVPAPGAADLFDPDPARAGAAPFDVTQSADVDVDTLAFYLYDTIEIGEHFEITGGVRGESYKATISDSAGGAADNFSTSPFVWNGKIGVVYKPAANGSLYASFGTSALPPGSFLSNPDISRTGDNAFPGLVAGAAPVRAHNYEAGVKSDFLDGLLSASAAVFRTDKRNVPIVGRPTGVTSGPSSLQGYHKQQISGVEIGVAGQITPEWSIFGGALLMDSKRKITPELAAIQRAANTGDFPGEYVDWAIDGDKLAFTPDFSATLWTTYRLPFGLTLGGGVQHVGSSWLGRPDDALRIIPNGRFGELPGYTLVNALLSYEMTENIDVRLNVDNLLNKKYAVSTNWAGSRAALGAPRTWLLSVGFSY